MNKKKKKKKKKKEQEEKEEEKTKANMFYTMTKYKVNHISFGSSYSGNLLQKFQQIWKKYILHNESMGYSTN